MITLNENEVIFGEFPNGEVYLDFSKLSTNSLNRVEWSWEEDNTEFIQLLILKGYLDKIFSNSELIINYMPYSRMDRQSGTYVFSLKYIAQFINNMNWFSVTIVEPHSDMTLALLDKSVERPWCIFQVPQLIHDLEIDSIFYPDVGAQKRYATRASLPTAVGYKTRDFMSGKITNYFIDGTVGNNILIVDDLCSRGGTFVEAAKKLREQGAKKIYLLVNYVEENIFTGEIFNHIDTVYCANKTKGSHKQLTNLTFKSEFGL